MLCGSPYSRGVPTAPNITLLPGAIGKPHPTPNIALLPGCTNRPQYYPTSGDYWQAPPPSPITLLPGCTEEQPPVPIFAATVDYPSPQPNFRRHCRLHWILIKLFLKVSPPEVPAATQFSLPLQTIYMQCLDLQGNSLPQP